MPDARPQRSSRLIIGLIMGALLVWSAYLAIGAYRYNLNPWRAVLVLGSTGAFLGFWLLMLWSQSRKPRKG